ncbi:hypothetical protein COOONC_24304 [Cooperia oncophora]
MAANTCAIHGKHQKTAKFTLLVYMTRSALTGIFKYSTTSLVKFMDTIRRIRVTILNQSTRR